MKQLLWILLFLILIPTNVKGLNNKAVVDITDLTVMEIQEYIDKGYLTYELLINLYLDRIHEYNDTYNALISINPNIIEIAKKCDETFKTNGRTSQLFCIPIIVKDNIDVVGFATTGGTKALSDSYPNNNSNIIQYLLDEGAIIIGKSNMSEFAFSAIYSDSSYGIVKNAYNKLYTTYGSSGGTVSALALSFGTVGIGTDTASSIRLPSSASNLVGLRPTYGLLSSEGIIKYDFFRDTAGPITKNVYDNALMLTAMANNGIDYTKNLINSNLKGKKIGVLTEFYKDTKSDSVTLNNSYYSEIDVLMEKAIDVMKEAGAEISYIDDFYTPKINEWDQQTTKGYAMCYYFNKYIVNTSSAIKNYNDLLKNGKYIQNLSYYDVHCDMGPTDYGLKNSCSGRKDYQKYVEDLMKKYNVDVLIYSNTKNKLLKLKGISFDNFANGTSIIAPATGFPALSIPIGFDSDGLPYGMDILSLNNQESLIYEVAYAYEKNANIYQKSAEAVNLYDVTDSLKELISKYELVNIQEYNNEEFIKIYNEVKYFLINYNEKEQSEINSLLEKFNNLLLTTKKANSKTNLFRYNYIGIILLILFSSFILLFIHKTRKKN